MSTIKLSPEETALLAEVGPRGDAYRRAIHDRAADRAHESGFVSRIVDEKGIELDVVKPEDPESRRPPDALP